MTWPGSSDGRECSLPGSRSQLPVHPRRAQTSRMLLNALQAIVEPTEVRDCLLSTSHPIGRFKATMFLASGYTAEDRPRLRADLLELVGRAQAAHGQSNAYGQKFEVNGISAWAFRPRGSFPRRCGLSPRTDMRPDRSLHIRGKAMHQLLDIIALTRDLPGEGLLRGDVGAVVEVLGPGCFEVEFAAASGRTQALMALADNDIRAWRQGPSCRRFACRGRELTLHRIGILPSELRAALR